MCLNMLKEVYYMNTSNIKNYKPKDFAELLGVSVKTVERYQTSGSFTGSNGSIVNKRSKSRTLSSG